MSSHGLTRDQIIERVRASRKAQDLPEHVTDPAVIRQVAATLRAAERVKHAS